MRACGPGLSVYVSSLTGMRVPPLSGPVGAAPPSGSLYTVTTCRLTLGHERNPWEMQGRVRAKGYPKQPMGIEAKLLPPHHRGELHQRFKRAGVENLRHG